MCPLQEIDVRFGLHHVQVAMPAGQEEAARRFYGTVLGMEEIPKPATLAARGGVWFRSAGGFELHLGVERPFTPARKAHPGILASDLDEVAERLLEAGIEVTADGNFPGFRRFYVEDCFGNRLEFLQPAGE
jgi:catechol 2,3-dioxygenase-like lactoylglutathione lyase family enzyme